MDEVILIQPSLLKDQADFLKNHHSRQPGEIQIPGLMTYLLRVFKTGRKKRNRFLKIPFCKELRSFMLARTF